MTTVARCTCDPRHLTAGGYDPGCPTHDPQEADPC